MAMDLSRQAGNHSEQANVVPCHLHVNCGVSGPRGSLWKLGYEGDDHGAMIVFLYITFLNKIRNSHFESFAHPTQLCVAG